MSHKSGDTMGKIREFADYTSLAKFIYDMYVKELGDGSEGTVYLGKDGYAYKLYYEDAWSSDTDTLVPEKIITTDDVDLECFAFPYEIYTVDGKVKGAKMKFIRRDLISTEHTVCYSDFFDVDIYKFYEAYQRLLEDVKSLSELKIQLFDVLNNVMFDGKKLTVIDTFYYTKEEYETLEKNIHILEAAIESIFNFWLENARLKEMSITNHDVLAYLENVFDAMSGKNKSEKFLYDEIISKKKR